MKDIHNHSLYGIDDGSTSFEESIDILKLLESEGVKEIVLTPHYIIGTNYNASNDKKLELLNKLKYKTNIKLYLGNEVFLDNGIVELIKTNKISTINNSRYILVELSLRNKMHYDHEMLYELRKNGYIPIIAHPERYLYYKIDELESFIEEGCLFQGNITSLGLKYGKEVKKRLIEMIKRNMIFVLGTDIHSPNIDLSLCEKELKKITNEEAFNKLIYKNFDIIISDGDII